MAHEQSIENYLYEQTQKLQDLEYATDIIRNKGNVKEELISAYGEVCNIAKGIHDLKKDVKMMRIDNNYCKELLAIIQTLDNQIQRLENNIPKKIQDYVKHELPKPGNNERNDKQINQSSIGASNSNVDFSEFNPDDTNGNIEVNDVRSCKKTLFTEPEIPTIQSISEKEFFKIPRYIIGRYSLETLNNLILTINHIIKSKYSYINLGKTGVKKKGVLDFYLQKQKEQMMLGPREKDTYFFTGEDFERFTKVKIDKTTLNLFIALRHCKRLREIRTAKQTLYALIL